MELLWFLDKLFGKIESKNDFWPVWNGRLCLYRTYHLLINQTEIQPPIKWLFEPSKHNFISEIIGQKFEK